ncbi:MAG: hypothetical protein H6Q14_1513 [Bacteroidetes bacterium]|nr:hypothetical protein [Bacteroidota bacterium]
MKTKNSILGVMIVSLVAMLSSCTASFDAHYGILAYNQHNRPEHVVNDPDLPPVSYLSPRQIDKIKDIRREEHRRVDYLEQRRREIRSELDRPSHSQRPGHYDPTNPKRLQKELRKVEHQIDKEHRRADDRVYSVLTDQQRRYWRR